VNTKIGELSFSYDRTMQLWAILRSLLRHSPKGTGENHEKFQFG